MKRFWAMLFLLAAFCLRAPYASAEARILRYGGSAADALTEIAVGAGGQRMPVVSLPDGTLALLPGFPPGVESIDDDPCLVLLDPNGSETAVPAPEAAREAVFYVNPDGGKYYHTLSECPSVNRAYWPLTPMTPQEIWKAGRYSPCPVCEAWTL